MKILYDHQIFCTQKYGGISRYFYELAKNLNRLNLASVKIFAPFYTNEYFNDMSVIRPLGIKLPTLLPINLSRRISSGLDARALSLLFKHTFRPEIFHETYYSPLHIGIPRTKRVITIHDMIHEKFPECFSTHDKTRENKKRSVRNADHIICVSENTRNDLIELLDVAEEKTSVVYHGHSFDPNEYAFPKAKSNKSHILYVGNRCRYKNFVGLLHAYSESKLLKNEFSIICFGGGNFTIAELSLMATLGIDQNDIIYVTGSDDALTYYYHSTSALVYPSLYEGFGFPPLEAMSCGCPVVCSNTSSLPEVVGDAAELFNPEDTTDMRLAIERVVSSPTFVENLIRKGKQRVEEFSWEKCARNTFKIYHQILNS